MEVELHVLVVGRGRVERRRRGGRSFFVVVETAGDDVVDGLEVLGVDAAH